MHSPTSIVPPPVAPRLPSWVRAGATVARLLLCVQLATTALFGTWHRESLISDWPIITWLLAQRALFVVVAASGLLIFACAAYEWYHERRPALFARPRMARATALVLAALALLVVLAMLSARTAIVPAVAWGGAGRLALIVALGLLAWLARPRVPELAVALGLALLVQSLVGLGQFVQQSGLGLGALGELDPLNVNTSGVSVVDVGGQHWLRAYGLAAHPNVLGGFLVVALLLLLGALGAGARPRNARVALWALVTIGLVVLLLTFSRSAWVGLFVGLSVLGAVRLAPTLWRTAARGGAPAGPPGTAGRRLSRLGQRGAVGATMALLAVGVLVRGLVAARLFIGDNALEARSIDERVYYAELAWRLILQRPWLGFGLDNFPLAVHNLLGESPYTIGFPFVHNVILLAAAELGVVAALVWILLGALGVAVPVYSLYAAHARGGRVDLWGTALGAAWLALWVIGLFDYYLWSSLRNSMVWPVLLGMWLAYWPALVRGREADEH